MIFYAFHNYMFQLIHDYAGGVTAAAEPEAQSPTPGMSMSAYRQRLSRFIVGAVTEFRKNARIQQRYVVQGDGGDRRCMVGIQYTAGHHHSGNAFVFSPYDYDTREEHVGVGYYVVENLGGSNMRVIRVAEGAVASTFTVPAPVLDHALLRELMSDPGPGGRAFVWLQINAVVTAILKNIAMLRRQAGYSGPAVGPAHIYDINQFLNRKRKAEAAAEPQPAEKPELFNYTNLLETKLPERTITVGTYKVMIKSADLDGRPSWEIKLQGNKPSYKSTYAFKIMHMSYGDAYTLQRLTPRSYDGRLAISQISPEVSDAAKLLRWGIKTAVTDLERRIKQALRFKPWEAGATS